ncbi:hypothetical protein KKG65_01910 [Patescibacteria group bacterium]|nr:hypothetical protein [Patescibacteria group bacterium]MBU1199899.1 hypothetical protein [Patescibacteria group bacterium]MBU1256739.1 hypothetical protein [Patescibacteria group bacterium]MBU1457295.1 hypothetical protein [Patescibacteria group bacterium]
MEKLTGKGRVDWSKVECNLCGNCCPNSCNHFDVGSQRCKVHPSIVGEKVACLQRGQCHGGVLSVFATGYYCEPVVEIIEEQLGIEVKRKKWKRETTMIANFDEVAEVSRNLRGLK